MKPEKKEQPKEKPMSAAKAKRVKKKPYAMFATVAYRCNAK